MAIDADVNGAAQNLRLTFCAAPIAHILKGCTARHLPFQSEMSLQLETFESAS